MSKIALFAATAALAIVGGIQAQTLPVDVDANIPFPFIVGKTTLPSGNYVVKPMDEGAIQVMGESGEPSAVTTTMSTRSDQPAMATELIFNRYGSQEFLSRIVVDGEQYGLEVTPSKAEKELLAAGQKAVRHSQPAGKSSHKS
ncbi:MAG: hypothetical protein R2748_03580 [Bryobacterales bacterium]